MSMVAHLLEESQIEFRYQRGSPYLGDTLTPQHLTRNPLGKIPCLEMCDGVLLSESRAICRYLARNRPEARTF